MALRQLHPYLGDTEQDKLFQRGAPSDTVDDWIWEGEDEYLRYTNSKSGEECLLGANFPAKYTCDFSSKETDNSHEYSRDTDVHDCHGERTFYPPDPSVPWQLVITVSSVCLSMERFEGINFNASYFYHYDSWYYPWGEPWEWPQPFRCATNWTLLYATPPWQGGITPPPPDRWERATKSTFVYRYEPGDPTYPERNALRIKFEGDYRPNLTEDIRWFWFAPNGEV